MNKQYPYLPHCDEWEHYAGMIARSFSPGIHVCADCYAPVVKGYCCTYCESINPLRPWTEKEMEVLRKKEADAKDKESQAWTFIREYCVHWSDTDAEKDDIETIYKSFDSKQREAINKIIDAAYHTGKRDERSDFE